MAAKKSPKTVVILGASIAGVPLAHRLLRHHAALVPDPGLKVILVSPTTDLYWNVASPRAVLPDMLDDDKLFHPILPAFAAYPSSQFEFVLGRATSLDPDARTVVVTLGDGDSDTAAGPTRTIEYHTVVVATGSSAREGMPWKTVSTTATTKATLQTLRDRIRTARSIVVAGAGQTGVELAGELGQEYAASGLKTITLVADEDLPLSSRAAAPSVRAAALRTLEQLKVRVLAHTKITAVDSSSGSGGSVTLQATTTKGGKTTNTSLSADLYLPTIGLQPNTAFLPARLLDASNGGRVKTTPHLRAEGYDSVFVVGDASNIESGTAAHTEAQVVHAARELEKRLVGKGSGNNNAGVDYKPSEKVMFGLSLGRNKGTGQMGTMKIPSLMIWWLKSRYLGVPHAPEYVKGNKMITGLKW